MIRRAPAENPDPVEDWFRRSGRRPPALRYEVRAVLPGGVLALRTNSSRFHAYLRERCRPMAAGRDRKPVATAEIRCLESRGWPGVHPGEGSPAMRNRKACGIFHSFREAGRTCVWRSPALMGCALSGERPRIRVVATPVDPRLCRRPPGGLRIKSTGEDIDYPEVFDLALCLFARLRGLSILHGAVLGNRAGGVLLAGEAGSGKTTAALALVRGGYRLLTDEYAALWRQGRRRGRFGGVLVPPMFVGRPPRSLAALEETIGAAAKTKAAFVLPSAWTRRVPAELRAIVILARPDRRIRGHRAEPMDKFELLSRLMAQVLDPIRGDREDLMAALLDVVERVPAYRVTVGTELATFPAFVEKRMVRTGRKGSPA